MHVTRLLSVSFSLSSLNFSSVRFTVAPQHGHIKLLFLGTMSLSETRIIFLNRIQATSGTCYVLISPSRALTCTVHYMKKRMESMDQELGLKAQ
jgi:hypothetical protein